MKIDSLTIVPPEFPCINDCPFCIAKMFNQDYSRLSDLFPRKLSENNLESIEKYKEKLMFVKKHGCDRIMITGVNEPLQTKRFLKLFASIMKEINISFSESEIQTSGILLDEDYADFLRDDLKVKTIALSVNSLDNEENSSIFNNRNHRRIDLSEKCKIIKDRGFNLRVCFNLLDCFSKYSSEEIFLFSNRLGIDEILFREIYSSNIDCSQSIYASSHKMNRRKEDEIWKYVSKNEIIGHTIFETPIYDVKGIRTIFERAIDSQHHSNKTLNLLLRSNCKLYNDWDSTEEFKTN